MTTSIKPVNFAPYQIRDIVRHPENASAGECSVISIIGESVVIRDSNGTDYLKDILEAPVLIGGPSMREAKRLDKKFNADRTQARKEARKLAQKLEAERQEKEKAANKAKAAEAARIQKLQRDAEASSKLKAIIDASAPKATSAGVVEEVQRTPISSVLKLEKGTKCELGTAINFTSADGVRKFPEGTVVEIGGTANFGGEDVMAVKVKDTTYAAMTSVHNLRPYSPSNDFAETLEELYAQVVPVELDDNAWVNPRDAEPRSHRSYVLRMLKNLHQGGFLNERKIHQLNMH